jgi:hypothetical protein
MRYLLFALLVVMLGCHTTAQQRTASDGGVDLLSRDAPAKDVNSQIGLTCASSETCGASAWCNPGSGVCQQRGASKISFTREVNPLFHAESCDSCHSAPGDIGAVVGTSGAPLIFSQSDPYGTWRALVAGGTNCADGLSRRVCVDDPRKSLLALFPLRIPGQPPFDSTQIVEAFTSWNDANLQTILGWIAEGAPFDGTDAGTKVDASPMEATHTDARPTDARLTKVDAQPDVPSRPDPLGVFGPLAFTAGSGCYAEQISWRAATSDPTVAAGVSYDVCYATTASGCANGGGAHQTVVGATAAILNNLGPGTYYVVVTARDDAGDVATAATASFTLALVPPGTPQGLVVTPSTSSPMVLTASWTAPAAGCTPAASYQICISTASTECGQGGTTPWTTATSLTATSITLAGFTPATTYYVFVRSVAQDGSNTGTPNVASATTGTPPDTMAPTSITSTTVVPSSTSCHAAIASWTAPTDDRSTAAQISYDVCYSPNAAECNSGSMNGTHQNVAAGTTSATITGLNVSTTYYLLVRGVDAANNENTTNTTPTTFSIPPAALVTPTGLVAGMNGSSATSLSLSWSPGPASDCTVVMGYEACASTAGACTTAGPWSAPTSAATSSTVVSGLTPNSPYYLSVRAVDGQGNTSTPAATATATTTLCSFATNVAPFLAGSCNGSCHLQIFPTPISYTTLASTPGGPNAGCTNEIDSSMPNQSFIYLVTQAPYCGSILMNPTGASIIATWVSQGALNN